MSGAGAKRGFKRETIFVELINDNHLFRQNFETALYQLGIIEGNIISAEDVKSTCKSDVKVKVQTPSGQIHEIGCSLKAAEANFNQLDRRWLSEWADVLNMPQEIEDMIQSSLDRKIKNSRDVFILPEQEHAILSYLESKKDGIFKELFTKEDENLKVFVAYDEKNSEWYAAKIDNIINTLKEEPFGRTNRGIVTIGNSLSLQRKGGDGNITRVPKDSPLHPSNHLQFKIKPLTIINTVRTVTIKVQ